MASAVSAVSALGVTSMGTTVVVFSTDTCGSGCETWLGSERLMVGGARMFDLGTASTVQDPFMSIPGGGASIGAARIPDDLGSCGLDKLGGAARVA